MSLVNNASTVTSQRIHAAPVSMMPANLRDRVESNLSVYTDRPKDATKSVEDAVSAYLVSFLSDLIVATGAKVINSFKAHKKAKR